MMPSLPLRPARNVTGSTLVMVMFVIAMLAIFIGLAFDFTGSTALNARRSADLSAAQALANGTLEAAYKRWQLYMSSNQSVGLPAAANASSYTSATSLRAISTAVLPIVQAAAAGTGFTVSSLGIVPVDRSDNQLVSEYAGTATTSGSGYSGPMTGVPGWIATNYTYRASATVSKTSNSALKVSVSRYFQQSDASLFQAMLFFENDLELHPGPSMTLYGLVHTNSNLYAVAGSGGSLTFDSNVSYHGNLNTLNPASSHPTNYLNNSLGYVEGVTQTLYNQESGNWNSYKNPVYTSSMNSQLSNVATLDPLGLSGTSAVDPTNGNASGTHEIIERPVPVSATNPAPNPSVPDPSAFASHRLWNSAGLRILINRNATTNGGQAVHVYQPVSAGSESSTEIVPNAVTPNIANQIASAITPSGTIYDFREAGTVVNGVTKTGTINLDTVDVSALTPVLNSYANYNGVIYISDITDADVSGNTGDSDAIRLKKGGTLPGSTNGVANSSGVEGLTIVTDGGVYIQGDYNTGTTYAADGTNGAINTTAQPVSNQNTDPTKYTVTGYTEKPASVIGDAVMVLSNAWLDSNSSAQISSRVAVPTTLNTAIVSGQVLTNGTTASGGAHNFPRFLENWTNDNFTYHGSMCELFPSNHFTGTYGKANVYNAPSRRWFFETSFIQTPPPGNLRSTTYNRGRWIRNVSL